MIDSFEKLGVGFPSWEHETSAVWETDARVEDHDGVSVLFFRQVDWWSEIENIYFIFKALDQEAKIYFFREYASTNWSPLTNDHDGKYFPERYYIPTGDNDALYFITQEEALAHIRNQYKISDEYDTFEKIQEYCGNNDLTCFLEEVDLTSWRAEDINLSDENED